MKRRVTVCEALRDRRWSKTYPAMDHDFGHPAEWFPVMGFAPKTWISANHVNDRRTATEYVPAYHRSSGWRWQFRRSYQ